MGNNGKSGCLASLLRLFFGGNGRSAKGGKRRKKVYPYRLRDSFLTPAELSFYHVLKGEVGDRAVILSKVGLWDIFFVARPNEHPGAKPHIDRKHVDFLLCQPDTMQPVLAIELDDSSHQKAARRLRDAEVDLVFETAQLPLLHIPVRRAYNPRELAAQLESYLDTAQASPESAARSAPPVNAQTSADGVPSCPKCGTPMVIRVANRGQHAGKQFYACPNYPNCKSIIPVE